MNTRRALLIVVLLGCRTTESSAPIAPVAGDSATGDDTRAPEPDAARAACDSEKPLGSARACAIQPSRTDPAIVDTFGWHAVGIPAKLTPATRVYIHLVGTGGDPYKPAMSVFPTAELLREASEKGWLVLMPAYDNEPTVASFCGSDLACYEPVRIEIITGKDAPPPYTSLKSVTAPNDIDHRLEALLRALTDRGVLGPTTTPTALLGGKVDWSRVRVGGHSQGGGHAGIIAKLRAVDRVCFFSSPMDGDLSAKPVGWATAPDWATPVERRRGAVHEKDPGYPKAEANMIAMGMKLDVHWFRLTTPTPEPHGFTVRSTDPAAVAAREKVCFD